MTWNDPPQAGERWRGPSDRGGRETRTVVDRTLGADVIYITGRRDHYQPRHTCSEAEWRAWQQRAKRL